MRWRIAFFSTRSQLLLSSTAPGTRRNSVRASRRFACTGSLTETGVRLSPALGKLRLHPHGKLPHQQRILLRSSCNRSSAFTHWERASASHRYTCSRQRLRYCASGMSLKHAAPAAFTKSHCRQRPSRSGGLPAHLRMLRPRGLSLPVECSWVSQRDFLLRQNSTAERHIPHLLSRVREQRSHE